MASRSDITYGIGADTRLAERQVQQFIRRTQAQINAAPMRLRLDTRGFNQPLGRITSDLNQFQGAMDASIARTLAFGASVGIINGVAKAFRNLAETTIRVEEALSQINVLLNLSQRDLSKFSDSLFNIAKNTAQSFDQVAIAATEFSRQGLSAAETGRRVNDALVLTRLSGLDAARSVESLTAAVNGFRKESLDTTTVVNRLANVDAAFAVSSADLANALSRAGSVSQDAKVSFNQLLAATTAVQQATARGGAVIGNGFKTIFTRLQRSKVLDELEKIGVATRDSTGGIRSAIDILQDYAQVYKTLGDEQRAFTAEQIAGVFQINTLKAIVSDLGDEFGIYNKALEVANNTSDEAVQRNKQLNETLSALLSQTGTEFERLTGKIGEIGFEDNFKDLASIVKGALESISTGLDSEGIGGILGRGIIKGLGNFLTGPALIVLGTGLFKLFKFIGSESATAFKQILEIGSASQQREAVQEKINQLLREDNQLLNDILGSSGSVEDINRAVERSIERQNQQYEFQKNLVQQIARSVDVTSSGRLEPKGTNAADGLMPLGDAIKKEKREKPAGSKVVLARNFPTPQGNIPFVAMNSSEEIRSNFGGSGFPAILNKDQQAAMARGGYIPNFGIYKGPKISGEFDALLEEFEGSRSKARKKFESLVEEALNSHSNIAPKGQFSLGGGVSLSKFRGFVVKKLGFSADELNEMGVPLPKGSVSSKKKKIYDAEKVGAFMATASYSGRPFIDVGFSKTAKQELPQSPDGTKYDRFQGRIAEVIKENSNSADPLVARISNIQNELDNALIGAAQQVANNILPAETNPALNNLAAGNMSKFLKGGGEGAVDALKGAFFESTLSAVVKGITEQGGNNLTLDIDLPEGGSKLLDEVFGIDTSIYRLGDFKISDSDENQRKYARQVIKNVNQDGSFAAAGGYIPNYNSKRVLDAVAKSPAGKRAMSTERAMAGSAVMGFDKRVGFGVFNKGQGSLSGAINEHLAAGDSRSSLRTMNSKAQDAFSARRGYVPNFISGAGIQKTNFSAKPVDVNIKEDDTQDDNARNFQKSMISALGLSIVGGLLEDIALKIENQSDKFTEFTLASTGANVAEQLSIAEPITDLVEIIPKWGGALSGTIKAIVGARAAFQGLKDLFDETKQLRFQFNAMSNTLLSTVGNLDSYRSSLERLQEAQEEGDASEILRLRLEAQKAGEGLTAEQRNRVAEGETTSDIVKDEVKEIENLGLGVALSEFSDAVDHAKEQVENSTRPLYETFEVRRMGFDELFEDRNLQQMIKDQEKLFPVTAMLAQNRLDKGLQDSLFGPEGAPPSARFDKPIRPKDLDRDQAARFEAEQTLIKQRLAALKAGDKSISNEILNKLDPEAVAKFVERIDDEAKKALKDASIAPILKDFGKGLEDIISSKPFQEDFGRTKDLIKSAGKARGPEGLKLQKEFLSRVFPEAKERIEAQSSEAIALIFQTVANATIRAMKAERKEAADKIIKEMEAAAQVRINQAQQRVEALRETNRFTGQGARQGVNRIADRTVTQISNRNRSIESRSGFIGNLPQPLQDRLGVEALQNRIAESRIESDRGVSAFNERREFRSRIRESLGDKDLSDTQKTALESLRDAFDTGGTSAVEALLETGNANGTLANNLAQEHLNNLEDIRAKQDTELEFLKQQNEQRSLLDQANEVAAAQARRGQEKDFSKLGPAIDFLSGATSGGKPSGKLGDLESQREAMAILLEDLTKIVGKDDPRVKELSEKLGELTGTLNQVRLARGLFQEEAAFDNENLEVGTSEEFSSKVLERVDKKLEKLDAFAESLPEGEKKREALAKAEALRRKRNIFAEGAKQTNRDFNAELDELAVKIKETTEKMLTARDNEASALSGVTSAIGSVDLAFTTASKAVETFAEKVEELINSFKESVEALKEARREVVEAGVEASPEQLAAQRSAALDAQETGSNLRTTSEGGAASIGDKLDNIQEAVSKTGKTTITVQIDGTASDDLKAKVDAMAREIDQMAETLVGSGG